MQATIQNPNEKPEVSAHGNGAEPPSNNNGKRKRALVACISCRRRKVRCDSQRPHCGNCLRAGIECVYSTETRKKRTKSPAPTEPRTPESHGDPQLSSRMDRLESMLTLLLEKQGVNPKDRPSKIAAPPKAKKTASSSSTGSGSGSGSAAAAASSATGGPASGTESAASSDFSDTNDDGFDDSDEEEEEEQAEAESEQEDSEKREGIVICCGPHDQEHHENNQNAEGSGDDDAHKRLMPLQMKGSDIFQLNDRRAPVVIMHEQLVSFSFGFTPSLLSPKSMRWLCDSIGNHTLGVQAEALLSRIWKQKTSSLFEWGKKIQSDKKLDPRVIEYSMKMHEDSSSQVMHALISTRDIQFVQKVCCPSGDYSKIEMSSPYALLYPMLVMSYFQYGLTNVNVGAEFTPEEINEQNSIAFSQCLKQISILTLCPATFLLLRLLLLTTFSMSRRMLLPHLRGLISLAIYMGFSLGLHSNNGSRYLKQEERDLRALVWAIIHDFDVKTASYLSLMPLMANVDQMPAPLSQKFRPGSEFASLATSLKLDRIYMMMYYRLFSEKARKTSVKTMLQNLLKIDNKLLKWKANLPQAFLDTIKLVDEKEASDQQKTKYREGDTAVQPGSEPENYKEDILQAPFNSGLSKEICSTYMQVSTMVAYYTIMILIHSIPAFSPSCLSAFEGEEVPQRLRDSLSIISESAKSILKLTFNMKRVQSDECLAMTATNAFSAMFLKQIRDPTHPTNASDLVQIYRYIAKFRTVTELMDPTDSQSIMNVWLIFANALTQLIREFPASRQSAKKSSAKSEPTVALPSLKPTPPVSDSENNQGSTPFGSTGSGSTGSGTTDNMGAPPAPPPHHHHHHHHHIQPPHDPNEHNHQQHALRSTAVPHPTPPECFGMADDRTKEMLHSQAPHHHHPHQQQHLEPILPQQHIPQYAPNVHAHSPDSPHSFNMMPPPPTNRSPLAPYIPYGSEQQQQHPQQQHAQQHAHQQPPMSANMNYMPHVAMGEAPLMMNPMDNLPGGGISSHHPLDQNIHGPPQRPYDDGSLWDAFSGMAGMGMDIDEDEIFRGFDNVDPQGVENPPNNCIIC